MVTLFDWLRRLPAAACLILMGWSASAAVPEPLARWKFDGDARDEIGAMHGMLFGGAYILAGRLVLNGSDAYMLTAPLPIDVTNKTLVATVRLGSLQQEGVGVLSIESGDGLTFDSIVLGELERGKWIAGSDDFLRTVDLSPAAAETQPTALIHIAIVYRSDGSIAVFRNGEPYGRSYVPSNKPQKFDAGSGRVLLGLRHSPPAPGKFFGGEIQQAELYDQALSAADIAVLATGVVQDQPLPPPSIARIWNEEILNAIRIDLPHPPAHARNLFALSAAMYDAWAAYDPVAAGFAYRQKHRAENVNAARREAISYAAYRVLRERYTLSQQADVTLVALNQRMAALGYDPNFLTLDSSTPAGLGNLVAAANAAWFSADGSRQAQGYADVSPSAGGYEFSNGYLDTDQPGPGDLLDVNQWQPLHFTTVIPLGQNGSFIENRYQSFQGSHWLHVRPFATPRIDPEVPGIDPGPPPRFGDSTHAAFVSNIVAVIQASSELTTNDAVTLDISPGAWGNNSLGRNDGMGHALNPMTGKPYAPNLVKRGDFARVLAEFWADGPRSETPPGHWNVLANQASDQLGGELRIGGRGAVVDRLEWDVKLYFALNAAEHDAACAAWSLKRHYNGGRPISAIRYLGSLGQSSEPQRPAYNTNGLPLIPNLIELVSPETSRPGGRHEGLPTNTVVIRTWFDAGGRGFFGGWSSSAAVHWIRAVDWFPYQRRSFVTPAFPGYVSGHSTFSRAAAEVLAVFTGTEFFPGGMGSYTLGVNGLGFDSGPSTDVTLQWATYYDAADQAGLSRIWGGIHPPVDDFTGRQVGSVCGLQAWAMARQFFDGTIANRPTGARFTQNPDGQSQLLIETVRGLFYRVQTSDRVDSEFQDVPGGYRQAADSQWAVPIQLDGPTKFFRVIQSDTP